MVTSRLKFAALLVAFVAPVVASRAALAVQSAELYTSQAYFYGRFEARIRFAPGEGVVSSFFLWKNGSSSTTSWNELDFEKINSTCRLQTNIWTGTGTQSSEIDTPSFNICSDYHVYAYEWTPDYIAWLIDGKQIRKVTGASVSEYTKNASQGMTLHFNTWAGNSTFGGTLDPSTLPVHEFISWVQYSSYSNGTFQTQWREEFDGNSMPSGWLAGNWSSVYNLSTHNVANVTFADGIAVLSMTADNATGFTGTPPVDSAATGTGGAPGTGGATATGGTPGTGGVKGNGGAPGTGGTPGAAGAAATGGTHGAGGAPGTGGTHPGSGGVTATGGTTATGGNTGAGGTPGTGGDSGTGGFTGTGGDTGTGGAAPGGGAEAPGSSSGCACGMAGGGGNGAALAMILLVAGALFRRRSRV